MEHIQWEHVYSKKVKCKITLEQNMKDHLRTEYEGPNGKERYSSTLSLTSALEGGVCLKPRFGRFTPGKKPGTPRIGDCMDPRAGLDECGKSPLLPGFEPETSRHTDYAIPTHIRSHGGLIPKSDLVEHVYVDRKINGKLSSTQCYNTP